MTMADYRQRLKEKVDAGRHAPATVMDHDTLISVAEFFGAKGLSVPDVLENFQWTDDLYFGVTSPRATTEVPHWHPKQTEYYIIVFGEAVMRAKYRWQDDWVERVARRGDVIIVRRDVCHLFSWRSLEGLALVMKAPQVPGVGREPNGKVTCEHCPHFKNGCVLPDGVTAKK